MHDHIPLPCDDLVEAGVAPGGLQVVAATSLRAGVGVGEQPGMSERSDLMSAWRPFAVGHKGVWWETVSRPDDVPPEQEVRRAKWHGVVWWVGCRGFI